MQQKLHILFTAAALSWGSLAGAQSIATFDDLELPGENTDFMTTRSEAGNYSFTSGPATFYGQQTGWGGYSEFNYSNIVDTLTESFTNDAAAITGNGYDGSENYGVAYASADWPDNPTESLKIGAGISTPAGKALSGIYITNTTYAYAYMRDYYTSGDFYRLVVRGYEAGVSLGDSLVYTLGEVTEDDTTLIKTWEWMDLSSFGSADSLTFQVVSSDDFTPFYFAFDNLTLVNLPCPVVSDINVTDITDNSAVIHWDEELETLTATYDVVIDNSATLEPTGTLENIGTNSYTAEELEPATLYYAHIRTVCDDATSAAWDTVSFTTLAPSGLFNPTRNSLSLTATPNPAHAYVTIAAAGAVNVVVYNMEGRACIRQENAGKIDISSLPAGIYVVKAVSLNGTQTGSVRFIKQ